MPERKTKSAIVLRVGQPPVVEQLECEKVQHYPNAPFYWGVRTKELQRICGGNVDVTRPIPEAVAALERELGITLASKDPGFEVMMFVHDEGMVLDMPINERATQLYKNGHIYSIHGDAVLVDAD